LSWDQVSIGSICFDIETVNPRERPDVSFRYVDISSVDKDSKVISVAPEILGKDAPSRARKKIRAGDILVSTVRPNLNAVALVPSDLDGEVASTGFCVLRPREEKLERRFLFYWTTTPSFVDYLVSNVRGAHYPAVSDGTVKSASIPLPPLAEQKRIVEILDQADALRKMHREIDAITERILPALFYKMFGDPVRNERNWERTTIKNIVASVRYGLGQPPKGNNGRVKLIRATNIKSGSILDENMMYVDPNYIPDSRNAYLSATEVIVVRSGAYTGDVAQVTEEYEGSIAGYDLIITPGENLVAEYLESYLLTGYIQNYYFKNNKSRAGQPHLNATQLENTPLLLPPREIQDNFADSVRIVRKLIKQQKECKLKINNLFSSLLYKAFSGELL
jgi:type I restriction enzyme, S subunit